MDLLLKKLSNRIDVAVYRKPTSTDRYITNNSFTTYQNKYASFNRMVYRLCRFPLNITHFMEEYEHIKRIATVDGFDTQKIDQLVSNHSRKLKF